MLTRETYHLISPHIYGEEQHKGEKKMKINIHAGHTRQSGGSPGASGIVSESVENRKIVAELISLLRRKGHTVYDTTDDLGQGMNDNLRRIVAKCNANAVDLDVSIHLNSSNPPGDGTETYVYSTGSKAKPYADRINANLVKLGYRNRGVKTANFYVLRNTNSPALLVETFFCNSAKDAALYAKHGPNAIALAIANGIDASVVTVSAANTVRYRTQGSVAIKDSRGNVVGWTKRDQVLEGTLDGGWLRLAPEHHGECDSARSASNPGDRTQQDSGRWSFQSRKEIREKPGKP